MSAAAWVPAAAVVLVAAAAVLSLLRGAEHHPGSVRYAFRWFAVAAVCLAAGLAIRQLTAPGPAGSITVADLPQLAALACAAAGLRELAHPAAGREPGPAGAGRGSLVARAADSYLIAAALFLIGWVTVFAGDYARWDEGAGVFAAEIIHPLIDVLVLGWALPLAVTAGRRAAAPCLALLAATASDALDVAARVSGERAGLAAQLLLLAAAGLLALTPRLARAAPPAARLPRMLPVIRAAAERGAGGPLLAGQDRSGTVMLAAGAAVAAALAVMAWGLAGSPGPGPVVALVGGSAVLALAARAAGLAWRQRGASQAWQEAGRQFRELAERTSDAVLVCDLDGVIRYASPAVADYGYAPDDLAGVPLADLLHPEDRPGGVRAARAAAADIQVAAAGTGPAGARYPCRVRAADGTWRHVQATVSRYRELAGPGRLLVTARDVSDQVALRRQVAHLTFHDGLTGLPNRAYIEDRARAALSGPRPAARALASRRAAPPPGLTGNPKGRGSAQAGASRRAAPPPGLTSGERSEERGGKTAGPSGPAASEGRKDGPEASEDLLGSPGAAGIVLLDLDGFTAVNDSAGHSAGDLILAQAARRLRAVVPPDDTVARWGGDEFAILIESSDTAREIIDIANRLAASISAHAFRVGDRELSLTASLGVALADGSPPGYVWRNADVAMSRAKDAGGGRVEVYAPEGDTAAAPRPALAAGLQEAIAAGHLTLTYQPVVELATGRVASAVAGVRMTRDGAEVPAADLLSAAEASGLIVPLGDWVLREACTEAGQWHQAGLDAGVWVKVPPAQAVAPRFADSVLAALAASGLPPAALTLEVTERDLVHGGGTLLPGLAEVRAHGVRLAIGDFGTDYASLSYLRRRPVDVVTIDPGFVAGLGTDTELAKLVEAIVRVGRDLGIEVVAAGIAEPGQLALLRAMGCQYGLGELVAPAVAARGLGAVRGLLPATPTAGSPPAAETIVPHTETKLLSS